MSLRRLLGIRDVYNERPRLVGLQLTASAYGLPVPIVYGTMRIPAVLIDYDDFTAIGVVTKQRVGKSTVTNVDFRYEVMAIYALCEGTISGIGNIWADKDKYFAGGSLTLTGFTLFSGALAQSVWSYLTTNHPTKAINYSGTAYVAGAGLDLGGIGSLKNYSFEVIGLFVGGTGSAGADADPSDVIVDFLTNARYGAGWDPSRIADMTVGQDGTAASSLKRYCDAMEFFISPAIISQAPATEHLREMLVAINAAAVFSEGVLKVFPYGDVEVVNGATVFTPVTTPAYDLNSEHLLPLVAGGDLVEVRRRPLADSFNVMPVEYSHRGDVLEPHDYNQSVVQDPDPVDAEQYGTRQGPTMRLPLITRTEHALAISRVLAQRSIYVRNTYKFRLPGRYCLLEPMDLVTLTVPVQGLDAEVVRITAIDETEDGALAIEAEEWPFGVASPTRYETQENDGVLPNNAVDPGDATTPLIFDIPQLVPIAEPQVDVGIVTGGGPFWGGAEVWLSYDDVTYNRMGAITQKGVFGELLTALAAGSGFDTTNTAEVDLGDSEGTLEEVSDQEATDLANLTWVENELLSFAEATLVDPFTYEIARILRGAFGTTGALHAIGSRFARMNEAMFRLPVPESRFGSVLYIKLRSFNIYGGGFQDLASCTAHSFTPTQRFGPAGQVPTLEVTPTVGADTSFAYTSNGLVSYAIDDGPFVPVTSSPIVVPRVAGAAQDVVIRATLGAINTQQSFTVNPLPVVSLASVFAGTLVCGGDWENNITWTVADPDPTYFSISIRRLPADTLVIAGLTGDSGNYDNFTGENGDPAFTGTFHVAHYRIQMVRIDTAAVVQSLDTNSITVETGPAC